jgi:phosphatidylserine decarboxylase
MAVIGALIHSVVFLAGVVGLIFTLFFFRDPERKIVTAPGQIVSPADGKVLSIEEVEEAEFFGGRCKKISIFLSIFNVHINRAPLGGKVEMVRYRRGKFGFANTIDASLSNESNTIGIRGEDIKVVVKQIAGAVARRIVCTCKPEQSINIGDRIGLIKFGSRTELYLPLECDILVSVGQKVKGGVSLMGAYDGAIQKKT